MYGQCCRLVPPVPLPTRETHPSVKTHASYIPLNLLWKAEDDHGVFGYRIALGQLPLADPFGQWTTEAVSESDKEGTAVEPVVMTASECQKQDRISHRLH